MWGGPVQINHWCDAKAHSAPAQHLMASPLEAVAAAVMAACGQDAAPPGPLAAGAAGAAAAGGPTLAAPLVVPADAVVLLHSTW
jgi:hypothetical protein